MEKKLQAPGSQTRNLGTLRKEIRRTIAKLETVILEKSMTINLKRILLSACLLIMVQLTSNSAQKDEPINDKDMSIMDFEDIGYPPLARQTNTQGVVVVRVGLDTDGKATEAEAVSGNDLLIPACLTNAKKWRFQSNSRRAAVIVYNFRMPHAACKSTAVTSFSIVQAPNFVTITGCSAPVQP